MDHLPSPDRPLRIGTRGSPLAIAQAHETRARLMAAHGLPEEAFATVVITTTGDRVQDRSLSAIGGKGLFTKEIEEALLRDEIDIAVHSMKDMPAEQPPGLAITTLLPREDVRDAFVSLGDDTLLTLPEGAVVGTSSLRRRAQLIHRRPDLRTVEFRGNVQTRMRKLTEGVADATFLAMAGLKRLGMLELTRHPVDAADMLPAIAQGAIGIEQREADARVRALLAPIHDAETGHRLAAERAFLRTLDGSCRTPIAGLAELSGGDLHLRGEILRPDGSEAIAGERRGPVSDAGTMGTDLAEELRARAGKDFFADW